MCLTAESQMADDVELDDHPLMLCLDAVINCALQDNSFTASALAIFDKFQCQSSLLHVIVDILCLMWNIET